VIRLYDYRNDLPKEYSHVIPVEKKESLAAKVAYIGVGIFIVGLLIFMYIWSIRPVYHTEFFMVSNYSETDGIALLIFNDRPVSRNTIIVGVGNRRHILVDVETGREIRLTYAPWRNYAVSSLISGSRVVIRNVRNDRIALIDLNTRQRIVPFGRYRSFWESRDDLGIFISEDRFMSIVNIQTGEEILPPLNFNQISFIHGTDDFVAVATRAAFNENMEYNWGILCLNTHELLTELAYGRWQSYQDGMIVLYRERDTKLVDLATGEEIIPFGEFVSIFPVGYGMAEVRQNWNDSPTLIEIATRDVLVNPVIAGVRRSTRAYNYEVRVERPFGNDRFRNGTFNLNTGTITWDSELTPEELASVYEKFNINVWQPFVIPDHLSHYDQVRILSNGWALVRDGYHSRFVQVER